ncbi:hypothetical protein B0J13DRAFT_600453 [Dactylonectria estremocensis]|uniref:Uncharacterized protein n=1 Tax=Dactylonectria estremocensis TaxID=1079267 RepID=A0A9P9D2Z4_9HYPO|nr:hypothetical protein B0J13DRAFT_600453 [Dactylonectria estremocensis]
MIVLHDPWFTSTKSTSPQKRQRLNEPFGEDTQHITKKHKLDHPAIPPPHFWDNLSQSLLTKNALRELDRRSTAELPDRAQLRRFARHGGPNLKDPRGSNTTPNTTTTRSTGPYDRAFQQHLIDHNVFPPGYDRVTASEMPIIEGDPGDTKCVASDVPFTNLDYLTGGSRVCAKPDLYYGARPEQLHEDVRQALSNLIVPSTQDDLPVVPNNFVGIKGPDGSLSSYGAAEPCYDNKAYALAWTYHGGTLKAYANHPIQPSTPGAQPGYVMTRIKGWSLTSDLETFRQEAAAFRNGRDWAKTLETSDVPKMMRKTPCSDTIEAGQGPNEDLSLPLLYESDTSADELSLDFERPVKRSRSPEKQASISPVWTARVVQQKLPETLSYPA